MAMAVVASPGVAVVASLRLGLLVVRAVPDVDGLSAAAVFCRSDQDGGPQRLDLWEFSTALGRAPIV